MSDCYAIACKDCNQSLWVGQNDYIYTVEPEITAFAKFLHAHRAHALAFDNTQEFIYSYREIDAKTFVPIEDDFFEESIVMQTDSASSPEPSQSLDHAPSE